jgi:AcrR family transcriptional regulator
VRLDEIARAAQATTGAIYHHFGSKPGLMLAVGEAVEQRVMREIGARIPADAGSWDALTGAVVGTLEVCARPEIANIIFREAPNVLGAAAWRTVEMRYGLGGLDALVRRVAADGLLADSEPGLVTRVLMAALTEAVHGVAEDYSVEAAAAAGGIVLRMLEGLRRTPNQHRKAKPPVVLLDHGPEPQG